MFNYPVEKITVRFYKYKFLGFDKPVVIEANNKAQARQALIFFINNNPEYYNAPVINESLSLPILGETTRKINGVENVWVGSFTPSNWMPLEEFNLIQDKWQKRK